MPAPSYTYSLTNGTTADASQVQQNFSDILAGVTDGSKDISISALTVAGAASFNGTVALGNATSDDVTFTGRIASDFDPKTAATYAFGDATQTWQALFLDNGATDGGAVYFNASSTAFIKSDASASDLDIGGFTRIDCSSANIVTTGNIGIGAALNVSDDLTIDNDSATATIRLVDDNNRYFQIIKTSATNGLDFFNSNGSNHPLFLAESGLAVGIGTTGPSNNLHIDHNSNSGGIRIQDNNDRYMELRKNSSNNRTEIYDSNANKNLFFATEGGSIGGDITSWSSSATQDVGFSVTTGEGNFVKFTSSKRYKKDITELYEEIDSSKIYDFRPVAFTWNSDDSRDFGFIAEEVAEILPAAAQYAVNEKGFILGSDGAPIPESVKYRQLTALIISEMKKLRTRIEALENAS